ncbi:hypothetical protein IFM12275_03480 [Nocardia sputorum]|nr:hypothetical protein IFM12275_03480 [Nocardia sputorum]
MTVDDYAGAFRCEEQSDRAADIAPRSGHECHSSGEPFGHGFFSFDVRAQTDLVVEQLRSRLEGSVVGGVKPSDADQVGLVEQILNAACHSDITADTGEPVWPRCRLSCSNIAYTDRDITQLRRHANVLASDLNRPGLPMPLHHRIAERLAEHEKAITAHESANPRQEPLASCLAPPAALPNWQTSVDVSATPHSAY